MGRSKSRKNTLTDTLAPASRQMRATTPRTTGTVMAKAVERTATPREARGQWERKVRTTQQENPEQVRLKPLERGEGQSGEREARERGTLRAEQGPLGRRGARDDYSVREALLKNQGSVFPLRSEITSNSQICVARRNGAEVSHFCVCWTRQIPDHDLRDRRE